MGWSEKVGLGWAAVRYRGIRGAGNLVAAMRDLWLEPERVASQVHYAQIEPTTICNLRCVQCDNPFIPKERVRHMTLPQFAVILDKLPYLRKLSLVGVGETLLNPDIVAMVRLARARGISVGFATNGTLLTEAKARALVGAGIDWINVSLDGATPETFERIRVGAKFSRVTDNVRSLVRVVGDRRKPELSVWFVAMQENLPELPALVRLVGRLGVRQLCVQGLHSWGKASWRERMAGRSIQGMDDGATTLFRQALATASRIGVQLRLLNLGDASARRGCNWPWKAFYVTVEGYVTPCCIHGTDPSVINFGNLLTDEFSTIWNGPAYQEFRRALKSPHPPSICVGCPSYHKPMTIAS